MQDPHKILTDKSRMLADALRDHSQRILHGLEELLGSHPTFRMVILIMNPADDPFSCRCRVQISGEKVLLLEV